MDRNNEVVYYFDMDGVLCDWVAQYEAHAPISLEAFNAMTSAERDVIKKWMFSYDFFRNMKPIDRGVNMIRKLIDAGNKVVICSATGHINKDDVSCAKIEWIREHICESIEIHFVDKVEMKSSRMIEGYNLHVLVDDRAKAIKAWEAAGGYGILFY
jgi:5'(3')-deoxyribonucleotidase